MGFSVRRGSLSQGTLAGRVPAASPRAPPARKKERVFRQGGRDRNFFPGFGRGAGQAGVKRREARFTASPVA